MITSQHKTSRNNFAVPQHLLLGLLVLSAWVLTSATPAWGQEGQCTWAPHDLIGWWPGDGNYKDITPSDHDGTPTGDGADTAADNDTPFTTVAAGEVGQAFHFDGAADYVQIQKSASDLNIPSGKITVDAWINPATLGQYYPSILGKGDMGSNFDESYALFLDPGGHVGFLVNKDGTSTGRLPYIIGSTLIPYGTSTWTLVAGTYDGVNLNVYVNGKLDGTVPKTGGIHGSSLPVLIGKSPRTGGGSSYFNGGIDEVELFNRALTGGTLTESKGEIGAIYTAGHAGKCKCQEPPAKAEGDTKNDDGSESHVEMTADRECDDNGEIDYKDNNTEMKAKHKKVMIERDTVLVSGVGTLSDGRSVDYTAVLVGNQPLIGANLFSITWTDAGGSVYQKSGVMLPGSTAVVPPQQ
jgi:hypothetical protein